MISVSFVRSELTEWMYERYQDDCLFIPTIWFPTAVVNMLLVYLTGCIGGVPELSARRPPYPALLDVMEEVLVEVTRFRVGMLRGWSR